MKSIIQSAKTEFNFVDEKFRGDSNLVHDIPKLIISDIKICIQYESQPNDELMPTTKKDLLNY